MNEIYRVLIVDDDRFNVRVLHDILRKTYKVMAANNGEQALKAVNTTPPDIILLDVQMPGMDGYEVCARLKSNSNTRDIPVIFISALGETTDETKGLDLGAVDYLTKPISPPIVIARIRNHLELKGQKDELKKTAKTLADLNSLKNKFLGMAAHDLRNPLSVVSAFSDMLLDEFYGPLDSKQKELIGLISSTSLQMLSLVNNLLDVSVIESGKLRLDFKEGSLEALIFEHVKIASVLAEKKSINITCDLATVVAFKFDNDKIGQVIDNLISNSLKFSPKGSEVIISLKSNSEKATISVKDQGPGIAKNDQIRIFSEFEKTSNKPTGGEVSTGLGLSIVKKIVDAHHGHIVIESEPSKGCIFKVELPFIT